jgi:hypothetical protein
MKSISDKKIIMYFVIIKNFSYLQFLQSYLTLNFKKRYNIFLVFIKKSFIHFFLANSNYNKSIFAFSLLIFISLNGCISGIHKIKTYTTSSDNNQWIKLFPTNFVNYNQACVIQVYLNEIEKWNLHFFAFIFPGGQSYEEEKLKLSVSISGHNDLPLYSNSYYLQKNDINILIRDRVINAVEFEKSVDKRYIDKKSVFNKYVITDDDFMETDSYYFTFDLKQLINENVDLIINFPNKIEVFDKENKIKCSCRIPDIKLRVIDKIEFGMGDIGGHYGRGSEYYWVGILITCILYLSISISLLYMGYRKITNYKNKYSNLK